jgi:hypothetical protein
LRAREPQRVERVAAFDREHVDEHRIAATEKDVERRRILEAESFGGEFFREVQSEHAGGVQHFAGPLSGVTGERNRLVLGECAIFIARENCRADEVAALNSDPARGRTERRVQALESTAIHFAQHAAVAQIKPPAGIAKRSSRGWHYLRNRINFRTKYSAPTAAATSICQSNAPEPGST